MVAFSLLVMLSPEPLGSYHLLPPCMDVLGSPSSQRSAPKGAETSEPQAFLLMGSALLRKKSRFVMGSVVLIEMLHSEPTCWSWQ